MPIEEKNILNRLYFVAGGMFLFSSLIAFKIINIQFVDGEKYRALAKKNTIKNWIIPSSRGNIYADDGSLLATSVPKYEIRFDAVTVAASSFKEHLPLLNIICYFLICFEKSLCSFFNNSSGDKLLK